MIEIEEILLGKNKEQLIKELNFQLKQGNSLGGNICSTILGTIKGELRYNEKNKTVSESNKDGGRKIK